MLILATFIPPTANASSCSNPHVAGPTVHISFVRRVLRNPFSFSSASDTASTSIEVESDEDQLNWEIRTGDGAEEELLRSERDAVIGFLRNLREN
jgi:hypothetical protein